MSMTYANAKIYVARSLGNSSYTDETDNAGDAIKAAIQEWNLRNDWKFLLMDTRNGFTVASSTIAGDGVTVTTTVANGFAGVNVGATVSGTGVPASTTVSSITSTTVIVISASSTPGTVTLTFGGEIPIRANTSVYNLPSPIKRPYTARLMTKNKVLVWKDWREIDRKFGVISSSGEPAFYMVYNPDTFATGNQNGKFEVFPTPDTSDTARVRFFRPIAEPALDADNIDVPDKYVYALLERGKFYYMKNKDSENMRTQQAQGLSEGLLVKSIRDDKARSGDRDERMVPFIEWGWTRQIDTDNVILVDW